MNIYKFIENQVFILFIYKLDKTEHCHFVFNF